MKGSLWWQHYDVGLLQLVFSKFWARISSEGPKEGSPAVIVEEVPSAQVEECYSAQVLVYDDGTYLMQDVAEEQEVVTEAAESASHSVKCVVCSR
uniref:E74-like factor 2a (ets domain transcription factor) n=1 Tax=Poecilia latipinna TaxID=48699 RepID=A0A3B3TPZ3_9TELE